MVCVAVVLVVLVVVVVVVALVAVGCSFSCCFLGVYQPPFLA